MAIQATVGEPLISYITLLDTDGSAIAGETFTPVVTRRPDGGTFALSVVEVGNGVYQMVAATAVGDPAGEWFALVQGGTSGRQFSETWDVLARAPAVTVVQESPAGGLTRRELRRQVSADLGDFYLFTATETTSRNTVKDAVTFARQVHHFRGMEITFTDGTPANVGASRFVQGSDGVAQTVTFSPELPDTVHAGDQGELHNFRGKGWTFETVNEAINAAIARAGEQHHSVPVSIAVEAPFDRSAPYVAMPEGITHFSGIVYTDRQGVERTLPARYWTVDLSLLRVGIHRFAVNDLNGRTLRVVGRARPAPLTEDGHRTSIPAEWLVEEAKALLLEADVTGSLTAEMRARLYNAARSGADARRQLIINRMPPNTVRVR